MSKAPNTMPSQVHIRPNTHLGNSGMSHLGGNIEPEPEAATAAPE